MIPQTKVTLQLLINAHEESGLYEIPDDLGEVLPGITREERVQLAKTTMAKFAEDKLIELWVAEWPLERARQLRADEASTWLEAETTWQQPTESKMYGFAVLSDAGKRLLQDSWKASTVDDNPS